MSKGNEMSAKVKSKVDKKEQNKVDSLIILGEALFAFVAIILLICLLRIVAMDKVSIINDFIQTIY